MHDPVLVEEVLGVLDPAPGGVFADGTVGAGGHAAAVLERIGDTGMLLAFDWDAEALGTARENLGNPPNVLFFRENFTSIPRRADALGLAGKLDGVLLDLGLSSMQLADPKRGFSFAGGFLDMRMDDRLPGNAFDLLHSLSPVELEKIIREFGEEPEADRIAKAITSERRKEPIRTAERLALVVQRAKRHRKSRLHPATLTFQALRIAVNRELENLWTALRDIPPLLAPGGVFAVISFHSLEDRLVKNAFRELSRPGNPFALPYRKPIKPSEAETARNPRARSARLRALKRLEEQRT